MYVYVYCTKIEITKNIEIFQVDLLISLSVDGDVKINVCPVHSE